MQTGAYLYQPGRNSSIGIFLIAIIAAIISDMLWITIIPFLYILLPWLLNKIAVSPKTIFWILIASIPFSTEINIKPSLGIDFPDEVLLILLTFLIMLKWAYQPDLFIGFPFFKPIFFLIILSLSWTFVSIFSSTTPVLSVKFLMAKIWFILPLVLFPFLFFNKLDFKKIGIIWLISIIILVMQVIIRHAMVGFSFEGIKETLSPFFRNHVAYAACLVCTLPIAITMYVLMRNAKQRKLLKAGILLLLVATVLSFSRGAWLAIIIGAIGTFVIYKKWLKYFFLSAIILVIGICIWLSYENNYTKLRPQFDQTIYHDEFDKHIEATVTLKDVSNAERFHRWVAGVKMAIAKPIMGFGPNSFYTNYKSYTDVHFRTWVSKNIDHSTVHNYYLLLAVEQGLPGMLLFVCLLIAMLLKAQQLYHAFKNKAYKLTSLAIGTIIIMIAVINTINDMIETDKIGAIFWLCVGLLLVLDKEYKKETDLLRQSLIY